MSGEPVRIIGIGGSLRQSSRTAVAMRLALRGAASAGADVEALHLADLDLPLFRDGPQRADAGPGVERLLEAVRGCDGLVLATPVYHATPSGALKNVLDYLELLADEEPPWLGGRLVGLVAVSGGGPGLHAITSLDAACRALNGWTLPRACAVPGDAFGDGKIDGQVGRRLLLLGQELVQRARLVRAGRPATTD